MRIIFMGTPEFAVASLQAMVGFCESAPHEIVGVVTATDKLGGRGGKQLLQSAVKKYAEKEGLLVLQPKSLKGKTFVGQLRELRADLQVVVAFRMLPQRVWEMPPLGTVNVHGSLLPAYRGAAPIHWAVVHGERQTGVTVFFLQHAIDTGDILLQRHTDIGPNETTGEVYERLMQLGADALVEAVQRISNGDTTGTPQNPALASHAPKLTRDNSRIDWSASAKTCHDFIRGMNPFPAARTEFDGVEVKVLRTARFKASATTDPQPKSIAESSPGSIFKLDGKICVATGTEPLELLELKPAGKRLMSGLDYYNGRRR